MAITVEQFIERLTQSGLMSAAEVSTFQDSLPPDKRPKDVQQLARALVQHGKLTKYQAQAVYEGKTKGLVFGEYVVLDKLGEGGMGVVLKAQHRRMKRLVAIKILSSAAMKQAGAVERFHREVEAAAKLEHPNIVTAYDATEHQGMHYLAMQYVDGKDLANVVEDHGPMGVRQAVECILQAARGLQYAHGKGIVHRDIKPGNLLLDKEGTVKILDMGLALIAGAEAALGGPERLTATGQVMGTCDYMSPEQALDTHVADHRTDIYALGCTLYRLLTGHPPYQGETLMQILLAHRENQIPSLCEARPEVPAELDACFQRMVAKEPGDRQQSMAEVVAELEAVLAVLSGRSVTAPPVPDESSSAVVARTLAFLQEAPPRVTLTKQKKPTADQRTQPHDPVGNALRGVPARTAGAASSERPERHGGRSLQSKLRRLFFHRSLLLAGLAGGLVLLLAVVLTLPFRQGTLVVEIDGQLGKDVQVAVSQGGQKVQLADATSGWTLSLDAGKYELAVETGKGDRSNLPVGPEGASHKLDLSPFPFDADDFQLDSQSVTVTHGGQVKVKVTLKPPAPAVAPFDAKQARKYQEHWARYLGVPVEMTNSVGMKLVLIPPGEFMMGSPKELIEEQLKAYGGDHWYKEHLPGEGPQHRVRITKPFYLGTYLVTQAEYQRVMGANPSEFSATGKSKDKVAGQETKRFPVECVSWDDAVEFCRKLSEMPEEKAAGRTYLLPSEAQWEYACRAGSTGRYGFSVGRSAIPREYEEKSLSDYGWFGDNAGGMPHVVGLKLAKEWGLYDPGYSIDSTSPYGLWLWGIGRVGHDAAVGYRFNLHCLL
jgi:serine/threonine protein kinase/formylglycine-generating enzyme required for sulfatase activity